MDRRRRRIDRRRLLPPARLSANYIGGKFLLSGFQYDPGKIWQMSFQAAAKMMTSGTTAISKHVEAAAGFLVGDFCALSHEQPSPVCSQVPSNPFGVKASSVSR
jgi:hypothetical protein